MARKTTLNEDHGKQINDIEAFLILAKKLIDDKLEQKSKSGIILAKGKPNERRFKFSEARKIAETMDTYFGLKGCFSIGICDTCTFFTRDCHSNKDFGTCTKNRCTYHCWDNCSNHSKEGGGYGI